MAWRYGPDLEVKPDIRHRSFTPENPPAMVENHPVYLRRRKPETTDWLTVVISIY
jgi:hypothetical protein